MDKITRRLLIQVKKMQAGQIILIGFAAVILVGSLLLTLPIATVSRVSGSYIDSLFTATSAVCVTGLVIADTGTHWSLFGQIVIILLIQTGGLGFMTVATSFVMFTKKKINLKERLVIQESLNQLDLSGLVKMVRYVVLITFIIEGLGAISLATVFVPEFGIKGIWFSVFHAISAFCNAGFDLMGTVSGPYTSMTRYVNNATVTLTISLLIIFGGIGYPVFIDVARNRKFKKLNINTKIVLITTAILLVAGTILLLIAELYNKKTIGDLGVKGKLLSTFFLSVSARTAGFNSIDLTAMSQSAMFIFIVLMFMGASPASTGGGLKTTTMAVIFLTVKSFIQGKDEIEVFERAIDRNTIRKSLVIFVIGITASLTGTLLISLTQPSFSVMDASFEVVSALATVGSSLAGSHNLNIFGKLVIISLMYIGRVGSLTLFMAVLTGSNKKSKSISYPDGKIMVG
ncbi:MAG: TrkH family potassium uptake protein [Clostridioides sp.]|nr:TrkH family potassium uptake protein [Clostridioides sp.]